MAQRKYTTLPFTEYSTASGNYTTARSAINQIILHSTVGTLAGAIATFSRVNSGVSAHYIVDNTGRLWAGLEEYYTGYHCGNYSVNLSSIGIEHEWYSGMAISSKLYSTSAKLVADICKYYGLGCNRGVVKAHKEIVPTACPNQIDVDRIVREAQAILNVTPPQSDLQACLVAHKQALDSIRQKDVEIEKLKRDVFEKNNSLVNTRKEYDELLSEARSACQTKIEKIINYIKAV